MADMAMVIHGNPADVHGNLARHLGNEFLLLAGKGIINA
jgi:hypothetical protein